MLPGGVVKRIDSGGRLVLLSCSREQIRCAPLYENDRYQDGAYRRELADYYAPLGSRPRGRPQDRGSARVWRPGARVDRRGCLNEALEGRSATAAGTRAERRRAERSP